MVTYMVMLVIKILKKSSYLVEKQLWGSANAEWFIGGRSVLPVWGSKDSSDKIYTVWQATHCFNSSFQMYDILELDYNLL